MYVLLGHGHSHGTQRTPELNENLDNEYDVPEKKKHGKLKTFFLILLVLLSVTFFNFSDTSSQMNMKGVYLHIITDLIGSVIVVLSASFYIWVDGYDNVKLYLDPSLSLIMVILIMCSTVPLVKETALILLQTTPNDVDLNTIAEKLLALPGVEAVHEFHVWRLVGVRIIATTHINFATFDDFIKATEKIKEIFHQQQIHSVTIQPEFTVVSVFK